MATVVQAPAYARELTVRDTAGCMAHAWCPHGVRMVHARCPQGACMMHGACMVYYMRHVATLVVLAAPRRQLAVQRKLLPAGASQGVGTGSGAALASQPCTAAQVRDVRSRVS